jgi:hypothetical protein
MAMAVLDATSDSIGVDTIEDAERVEDLLRKEEGNAAAREGGHGSSAAPLFSSPSKKYSLT